MENALDDKVIQKIWEAHRLGTVKTLLSPQHGVVNRVFVVNDTHVIRFDVLLNEGYSRYHREALAYQRLRAVGVPAPEVIAVDTSKTLTSHDYLIMTKLDGTPVIDSWAILTADEREQVACDAGRYLALMHGVTFEQFGKYNSPESDEGRAFPDWFGYVKDYFGRYARAATEQQLQAPDVLNRMRAVLERYRPVFDSVEKASLIHRDFHFENVLQQNGRVTGILDFEWSVSGDPSYDFIIHDQWEEECPGSRALIYESYSHVRALPDDHELRVQLYRLFFTLECVVDAWSDEVERTAREQLNVLLDELE